MATWTTALTTLVDWLAAVTAGERVAEAKAEVTAWPADAYAVRPLPGEAVCLWRKTIDNSAVVPRDVGQAVRAFVQSAVLTLLLTVGVFLTLTPVVQQIVLSYRASALRHENQLLERRLAELEAREAELCSPRHLSELASRLGLSLPDPARRVVLSPTPPGALIAQRK